MNEKRRRNRTKLVVLTLVVSLFALTLAGCGGDSDEKAGGSVSEIKVGIAYEPETLDLSNYSGDTSLMVIQHCTEPLLRNVDGQAEPGVAESYDVSEDGTVYTFHLRDSSFSDGTKVTANDIYYSIMRTLDPEKAMELAYHIYDIKGAEAYFLGEGKAEDVGVKVIDDNTLEITTEQAAYPLFFTDPCFAPLNKKLVEDAGEAYGSEAEYFCNNGPYVLTAWTHESEVVLEKNQDYWNADAIKTEKIIGKINVEGQTAYDMMVAGELDVCEIDDMELVNELLETGDYEEYVFSSGVQLLNINQKGRNEETGKWLANADFRRALSYAIDREALVKAVENTMEPATRLSSPSLAGVENTFNEEYPYEAWTATADEAKAKECLDKAMKALGASDVSEIPELSLLCNDNNNNMNYLNAISDMWKKTLGVRSVIDAQPLASMLSKADNGDFDLWKGGKSYGLVDWTGEIGAFYLSNAGNPNNNSSKDFDNLYYKTVRSKDWKERKDNIFEMEQYFCDNSLSLVLLWSNMHEVHRSDITGFKTTSDGYCDFTYMERK